jgi:hypothetical protein
LFPSLTSSDTDGEQRPSTPTPTLSDTELKQLQETTLERLRWRKARDDRRVGGRRYGNVCESKNFRKSFARRHRMAGRARKTACTRKGRKGRRCRGTPHQCGTAYSTEDMQDSDDEHSDVDDTPPSIPLQDKETLYPQKVRVL